MEFDHVRGEKTANIAKLVSAGSLGPVLQELDKCELVCANCHRIRHLRRREAKAARLTELKSRSSRAGSP